MKKIKQIGIMFFVTCLCISMHIGEVKAAGVSVSANKSSITLGSSFNVTISANTDCYFTRLKNIKTYIYQRLLQCFMLCNIGISRI
ncbi:MAG: hypothetical protein ACLUVC_02405 [Longibaculum sp.]